jgi:hypothetical protein
MSQALAVGKTSHVRAAAAVHSVEAVYVLERQVVGHFVFHNHLVPEN